MMNEDVGREMDKRLLKMLGGETRVEPCANRSLDEGETRTFVQKTGENQGRYPAPVKDAPDLDVRMT